MESRRFGPKTADHPSIGETCHLCDVAFIEGDFTALVGNAPADDEEKVKMEAGRPYIAAAAEVHWTCYQCTRKMMGRM